MPECLSARFAAAQAINLEGCGQIDDDIASQFPALACLKVLNLSHCTKMTDDGIVCISEGCLLLEDLNVDGIPWITDRYVCGVRRQGGS